MGPEPKGGWRVHCFYVAFDLAAIVGMIVLARPILSGVGWRVLYLSIPDLTLVIAAVGMLLLALGLARGARVLRPMTNDDPSPSEPLSLLDDG
ncbi:MAG: hypothetical protein ACKVZ6_14270 [Kineosporiaceae bacterium]